MGNLAPRQIYANVSVNGQAWGIMNVEEHISKELLELQGRKESIVVKFGDDRKFQLDQKIHETIKPYQHYRLGDERLTTKLYQDKKYLKDENNRLLLSYIVSERLKNNDFIYDLEEMSKAYILAAIWGDWHPLASANSRYYFNPYTLKLQPITTDAAPPYTLTKSRDDMRYKIFDPYDKIVSIATYKNLADFQYPLLKRKLAKSKDYLSEYQSYFPADDAINLDSKLNQNIKTIEENPEEYLYPNIQDDNSTVYVYPTKEQAESFPQHIHAIHFTNGELHVYNLLPEDILITSIKHNGTTYLENLTVDGFEPGIYRPFVVKTAMSGILDETITIETDYKGFAAAHTVGHSLIPGPYHNPIQLSDTEKAEFLYRVDDSEWVIKRGDWRITEPIILTGNVRIESGTNLLFDENSYLLVKGSVIAAGHESDRIVLSSHDYWKGLYVIGDSDSKSVFKHVDIKRTRALEVGLLRLTGGVTFYDTVAHLKDVRIISTKAEDALNIINSSFVLDSVNIMDTNSDGFDSDFSNGTIEKSVFSDIGGDAIDFSGSEIEVENATFQRIRDKAVSVGEGSIIKLDNLTIHDAGVGVASKDGSSVELQNLDIYNYDLHALMTYVKKDYYDKPFLTARNLNINPRSKHAFLAQDGTTLLVENLAVSTRKIDVGDMYETRVMKK